MQIPGHLAVALAQYRLLPGQEGGRKRLAVLLFAALFPDMVDKSIGYVFGLMPNGRHYAHNIFSLVGSSALVAAVGGRAVGRAWFAGYLGHLLADSNRQVPWLFPLKTYPFRQGRLSFKLPLLAREMVLLAGVLLARRAG